MKVLKSFIDKETRKRYAKGDTFGSEDSERVAFLVEKGFLEDEVQKKPSKETGSTEFPKHTGGGYFELPNGEKIKGKDEATAAQEELNQSQE